MNQSIQYNVEDAVKQLLQPVSGLNVYITNRTGGKLYPRAVISASVGGQMLGNYTGVYELSVSIDYSDTAAKVTQEDFDSEYCSIFEALYSESPTLATKIQNNIIDTKVYMARITSQTPTIKTAKREWQRGLTLSVIATPSELDDGLRFLDFSEQRNSMYVGVI